KPDQECVLAVRITRSGFDWALDRAVPSDAGVGSRPDVRVQWDPERDLHLSPLPHRSRPAGQRRQNRRSDAYRSASQAGCVVAIRRRGSG
ncbi:DUF4291 domain-containing protein, partial [Saccharothrix sp. MB29]|nr:DUF4291 domain-containing protein [Saccharothrix sp. MB29]